MDDDGSLPRPGAEPRVVGRRRRVAVAVAVAAVIGASAGAAIVGADTGGDTTADAPALVGPVASSTTSSTTGAATGAATGVTTRLALSQPQNPPEDEYADVPVVPVASIEIPSIGLVSPVYEGIWLTVLDRGPGHWPGTAAPGGYGNVVVAGHRASFSRPFRHLDDLAPGDRVVLADGSGRYTYSVTGSTVVTPEEVDIVTQRPGRTMTLFACHPPGSAAYRYVVSAELLSAPRPGA